METKGRLVISVNTLFEDSLMCEGFIVKYAAFLQETIYTLANDMEGRAV